MALYKGGCRLHFPANDPASALTHSLSQSTTPHTSPTISTQADPTKPSTPNPIPNTPRTPTPSPSSKKKEMLPRMLPLLPLPLLSPSIINAAPAPTTTNFTGVDHCKLADANNPGPCAPFTCPSVAARKQTLRAQGATAQDLAIAMLETGCPMDAAAYPVGDVNADGSCCKTGDAANYGLFKNNWGTIRRECAEFGGQDEAAGAVRGGELNKNDALAITCQHEQISKLGDAGFYKAQRGVGNGDDYATAITYIENYLNQGHLEDGNVTTYFLGRV